MGKYLSRRIPYASNGSFNPFAISNKEVHIVNGDINNLETSELYKEKSHFGCDTSSSEGSTGRDHFRNYC